ncbi:MAG: hypothetical protein JWO81_3124, partial [Alphaproteobacteria bacterium]|nr:hypothetical protein [Alphaproteobacteria bacterium]
MGIPTSSLLRSLGAEPDPTMVGVEDEALRLRFGRHSVQCGQFTSRWLTPTYLITGVINTGRTIVDVQSEMPVEVATEEEGLAWLGAILGAIIPVDVKPDWLFKGERLRNLLP